MSIPLSLLFENEQIAIFAKPTGMPSVPLKPEETETAVHQAIALVPALARLRHVSLNPDRQALAEYGLLHRLDTGTSGALAFAKTEEDFLHLRGLWKSGEVKKTYRALVRKKNLPSQSGPFAIDEVPSPQVITTPLGHSAKSKRRMLPIFEWTPSNRYRGAPQPAHTEVLATEEVGADLWDFTLQIKTGVMHQIRAHLASIGYPIQGDPIYGSVPSSRLWLHAWRLALPLRSGETIAIEAPLPLGWPTPG